MKDGLDKQAIRRIATSIQQTGYPLDSKAFIRDASKGLSKLALKQRVQHIITVLHRHLPDDFYQSAEILFNIKQYWDYGDRNDPLSGFAAWPVIDFSATYGLQQPETALELLKHLTPLFSAEFAIRAFLIHHYEYTYQQLQQWCGSPDEHVRRLVSEGTRPRLPWGQRLNQYIQSPQPVIKLLNRLKDDPSLYVRRSVANNLNDISKDHPDTVIRLCRQWHRKPMPQREWIIKHACRSLIKAGHPECLTLLGFSNSPEINKPTMQLSRKTINMGESLDFTVRIKSRANSAQKLVVDYAVHYIKANGSSKAKMFKLKTFTLAPGDEICVSKTVSFKPITTRRYYPGRHIIELFVNGNSVSKAKFLVH